MSFFGKGSGSGQACASCKYQRRKCDSNCILAPYFPPDQMDEFLSVHKLFGVSNIQKMLRNLRPDERSEAMRSLVFQANARKRDPVHGCLGIVRTLHTQVELHKKELQMFMNQIYYRELEQQKQQHAQHVHQQQQQHFMPSSPFYQPGPPMINAFEPPAPYMMNNLENDMDFVYNMASPLLPTPPHFQDFEDPKPYERVGDFPDKRSFYDRKEEAPDESSAESSLREIPTIGQDSDRETKHNSGMFNLTNAIHEQEKNCMVA